MTEPVLPWTPMSPPAQALLGNSSTCTSYWVTVIAFRPSHGGYASAYLIHDHGLTEWYTGNVEWTVDAARARGWKVPGD